jgi:hypothetical protein
MLVYGDRSERDDPRKRLEAIAGQCLSVRAMAPGLERHSRLVDLLIESGRLLQGIADADFAVAKHDRRTEASDALGAFLVRLGAAVCRSWTGEAFDLPEPPTLADLPLEIELKQPEGFAFYAVYPEAFAQAATRLWLSGPPCVIGIRSIGTSLGAIVAAAVGAPSFVTVRPFGDPFARQIAIAPELEREVLAGPFHYLIVDEGPGQSGSSFGAVADWLQERGVPIERIAFLPSHGGDLGPNASDAHRVRWSRAQKAVADLGPRLPLLLEQWTAELLGPLDAALADISGGNWRERLLGSERGWPGVTPAWERRKYLARFGGETWLLKFAGLGGEAQRKFAMAQALHGAGWAAEPRGVLHGFLVERWHDEAAPLAPDDKPLAEIGSYLGARARLFGSMACEGASVRELYAMTRRNVSLAIGTDAASALERWASRLDSLERRVERFATDNKLDRHEWVRLGEGRLLKCDALDHHSAHDLIGAQDLAWDVAGASVEFGLDSAETTWLAAEAGRSAGRVVDRELLEFLTLAYLAFRLGQARLSIGICSAAPAEMGRLTERSDTLEQRLRHLLLDESTGATRRESSFETRVKRTAAGTIPAASG